MKIRSSHVTNSSSSSFCCNFCTHIESGWDLTLDQCDMIACNGKQEHFLCKSHIDTSKIIENEDDDWSSHIPASECPLCNFDKMSNQDLIVYLLMSANQTREEITAQAKMIYGTVDNMYEVYRKTEKGKKC